MKKIMSLITAGLLAMSMAACAAAPASNSSSQKEETANTTTSENTQTTDTAANETVKDDTVKDETAADSAAKDQSSDTTAKDTASTNTQNTTQMDVEDAANALSTALKNQGFTVQNGEYEFHEISFYAYNDTGRIDVEISKHASAQQANYEYLDNIEVDEDEQFFSVDNFSGKNNGDVVIEMTVLSNTLNGLYDIEGVNTHSKMTYSISGINQASLKAVKEALREVGFQKK